LDAVSPSHPGRIEFFLHAFGCRKTRVVSVDEVHTSRQTHPSPEQHRLAHLVRTFQVLRGTDQGRKFLPGKWYMLHQPAGSVRVFGVAVGAQMMKYLQIGRASCREREWMKMCA